jgi:hypothetical protein
MEGTSDKTTSCVACQNVKVKCEHPGAATTEKVVRRRKRAAEESPQGKAPPKRLRTESEVGTSGARSVETEELGPMMAQVLELVAIFFKKLDHQNDLLEELVNLKTEELWGGDWDSEDVGSEPGEGELEVEVEELRKEDDAVPLFPAQSEDAEGSEVSDTEEVEVVDGAEEGSDAMM